MILVRRVLFWRGQNNGPVQSWPVLYRTLDAFLGGRRTCGHTACEPDQMKVLLALKQFLRLLGRQAI